MKYYSGDGNQSEDSDDRSSEAEALTEQELEFIEDKYDSIKDKLKNIVNENQIKNKCIALDFDNERIDQWVESLVQIDQGY